MRLKIVSDLIDTLNKEKLLYCHWKSNQHVKDAFSGVDDIDLLISQSDIEKLNIILNKLGYKRFRLPNKRSYIGIEDYIGYDINENKFVHLHLHYKLTIGEKFIKGYQIPYSKIILNRRVYDNINNIYTTSHEDEMWLLLIRLALKYRKRETITKLFKKRPYSDSVLSEFYWLQERIDLENFQEYVLEIFNEDSLRIMLEIIKKGLSFRRVVKLNKKIKKEFIQFKSYSNIKGTLLMWSREFFRVKEKTIRRRFKKPILYRRSPISGGKIISFIGPDGAGKSTVIKETQKKLYDILDVNRFYLGSGDGKSSFIRYPFKVLYKLMLKLKILDRKSKKIDNYGSMYRDEKSGFSSIIRKIGKIPWYYTLSRERRKKLLKIGKFKNSGYLVLTDRYPQVQIFEFADGPQFYKNKNIKKGFINNTISKFEKKSFIIAERMKPDIVIVLKVSPEIAYKRKPDEINIKTNEFLMNSIMQLDFGIESTKIIIDADKEIENVVKQVISNIWSNI